MAGLRVVAGSRSGRVYVLNASNGECQTYYDAGGPVESIDLSPDEALIALRDFLATPSQKVKPA